MAGGTLVEERHSEVQHPIEHFRSQIVHHVARHIGGTVIAQKRSQPPHGKQSGDGDRDRVTGLMITLLNGIDDEFHQFRPPQLG